MNVLIVEDNLRMRAAIKRTLEGNDIRSIHECSNGEEAIESYERIHPDWILMDIQMEPMDGLAASRIIMRGHPNAKIIILTNYDDAKYRQAAEEVGVYAYVLMEDLWKIPRLIATKMKNPLE